MDVDRCIGSGMICPWTGGLHAGPAIRDPEQARRLEAEPAEHDRADLAVSLGANEILGFLKGYFLPWNVSWMALSAIYWFFLTPSVGTLKTFAPGWIALIYLRNSAAVLIF